MCESETRKFEAFEESTSALKGQRPSLLITLAWRLEDVIAETNWKHFAYKLVAFSYMAIMMWVLWLVLPIPGHWPTLKSAQCDKVPIVYQDFSNYFGRFEGFAECGIRAKDLYILPVQQEHRQLSTDAFCPNRQELLQALSDGGRIGFDAPYQPKGCAYRWYSVDEVCFILERFDGVVFVGDTSLQAIYSGLNVILRQDLAGGALRTWQTDQGHMDQCRCNSQFTNPSCHKHFVTTSDEVIENTPNMASPYYCSRTPHALLRVESSPAPLEMITKFKSLVPEAPRSKYKPIPIIHSVSPNHFSEDMANQSLTEFLSLADDSQRKTPMLWIGPTAATSIESKDRISMPEILKFDRFMAKAAVDNDIEVVNMYNMTAQASTTDGLNFGEGVAIVQAMMVVNWLSRLQST